MDDDEGSHRHTLNRRATKVALAGLGVASAGAAATAATPEAAQAEPPIAPGPAREAPPPPVAAPAPPPPAAPAPAPAPAPPADDGPAGPASDSERDQAEPPPPANDDGPAGPASDGERDAADTPPPPVDDAPPPPVNDAPPPPADDGPAGPASDPERDQAEPPPPANDDGPAGPASDGERDAADTPPPADQGPPQPAQPQPVEREVQPVASEQPDPAPQQAGPPVEATPPTGPASDDERDRAGVRAQPLSGPGSDGERKAYGQVVTQAGAAPEPADPPPAPPNQPAAAPAPVQQPPPEPPTGLAGPASDDQRDRAGVRAQPLSGPGSDGERKAYGQVVTQAGAAPEPADPPPPPPAAPESIETLPPPPPGLSGPGSDADRDERGPQFKPLSGPDSDQDRDESGADVRLAPKVPAAPNGAVEAGGSAYRGLGGGYQVGTAADRNGRLDAGRSYSTVEVGAGYGGSPQFDERSSPRNTGVGFGGELGVGTSPRTGNAYQVGGEVGWDSSGPYVKYLVRPGRKWGPVGAAGTAEMKCTFGSGCSETLVGRVQGPGVPTPKGKVGGKLYFRGTATNNSIRAMPISGSGGSAFPEPTVGDVLDGTADEVAEENRRALRDLVGNGN